MENINPGPYYFYPFMPIHKIVEEEPKDLTYYDELYSPELTLLHGNAYKSQYQPYKNYQPSIPFSKDRKEKSMLEVQMYFLIMHDLKLHLDIWPNDKKTYDLFKKYAKEYETKWKEYEKEFGPLVAQNSSSSGMFSWVEPSDV